MKTDGFMNLKSCNEIKRNKFVLFSDSYWLDVGSFHFSSFPWVTIVGHVLRVIKYTGMKQMSELAGIGGLLYDAKYKAFPELTWYTLV